MFQHAAKLGWEGIVSKSKTAPNRSARTAERSENSGVRDWARDLSNVSPATLPLYSKQLVELSDGGKLFRLFHEGRYRKIRVTHAQSPEDYVSLGRDVAEPSSCSSSPCAHTSPSADQRRQDNRLSCVARIIWGRTKRLTSSDGSRYCGRASGAIGLLMPPVRVALP
jgi:hypothetical protein